MHEVESMVAVVNKTEAVRKNRTVPWHGLGVHPEATLTDEEVLDLAGLNWNVSIHPVYVINPATGLYEQVEKSNVVLRDTDGRVLGRNIGDVYAPFQNADVIDFGSTLVDDFGAKWDTAGSLRNGEIVFASFRLDDISGLKLGGVDTEEMDFYLVLGNHHTGNGSFSADVTGIRTVCMNTFNLALKSAKVSWKLRHTGTLNSRVEEARRSLDLTTKYVAEFQKVAEQLADSAIAEQEIESLIEELIPVPEKRGKDKAVEQRDELRANIFGSPTIPKDLRGTKWGVLNGVSEWAEHERDERKDRRTIPAEKRFVSNLLNGASQDLRNKAFGILTR